MSLWKVNGNDNGPGPKRTWDFCPVLSVTFAGVEVRGAFDRFWSEDEVWSTLNSRRAVVDDKLYCELIEQDGEGREIVFVT